MTGFGTRQELMPGDVAAALGALVKRLAEHGQTLGLIVFVELTPVKPRTDGVLEADLRAEVYWGPVANRLPVIEEFVRRSVESCKIPR